MLNFGNRPRSTHSIPRIPLRCYGGVGAVAYCCRRSLSANFVASASSRPRRVVCCLRPARVCRFVCLLRFSCASGPVAWPRRRRSAVAYAFRVCLWVSVNASCLCCHRRRGRCTCVDVLHASGHVRVLPMVPSSCAEVVGVAAHVVVGTSSPPPVFIAYPSLLSHMLPS